MWLYVGVSDCLVLFWGHLDLDLWHISYIIGDRNPKFSVWIDLGVAECYTLFKITVTLTSGLIYVNLLSLGAFLSHCDTSYVYAQKSTLKKCNSKVSL